MCGSIWLDSIYIQYIYIYIIYIYIIIYINIFEYHAIASKLYLHTKEHGIIHECIRYLSNELAQKCQRSLGFRSRSHRYRFFRLEQMMEDSFPERTPWATSFAVNVKQMQQTLPLQSSKGGVLD